MIEESDEQLIARLKSEPEAAFRVLYDRYSGILLRFIYRFTGDQQMAEDILHDIFMEILAGNFREFATGGLKGWLFTLAKNKSLNSQRGRARETVSLRSVDLIGSDDLEEQTGMDVALNKLQSSERTMPTELLDAWRLRRQGLRYQQIADQLSIPIGTVKSRFHRLVIFLREELEK